MTMRLAVTPLATKSALTLFARSEESLSPSALGLSWLTEPRSVNVNCLLENLLLSPTMSSIAELARPISSYALLSGLK